MSITLSNDVWKIKDGQGQYRSTGLFSTGLPDEAAQLITDTTAAINTQAARASSTVATMQSNIATATAAVEAAIQSGIDPTLSLPNIPAEAKAVGDALKADLAAAYSSTGPYAIGDYCLHDNLLYRCTAAISSVGEAWNGNHWTRTPVGDELGELKSAISKSESMSFVIPTRGNLYNKNDITDGYYTSDDNDYANTNDTYKHTVSIIPIIPGAMYVVHGARKVKLYIDSVFSETVSLTANSYTLTSFGNANGMRFDMQNANANSAILYLFQNEIYTEGDYDNVISYYKDNGILNDALYNTVGADCIELDAIIGLKKFSWNVCDNLRLIYDCQIDYSTGKLTPAFHSSYKYAASDYSPVTPGETIYFNGYFSCYNANKEFLNTIQSSNQGIITIPSGVAYIRTYRGVTKTAYNADPTSIYIYAFRRGYGKNNLNFSSTSPKTSRFPIFDDEDSRNGFRDYLGIRPYADMKFAFLGDSFSAPGVWQSTMCNILGASVVSNRAVSGGSFATYTGYVKTAYQQAQELVSNSIVLDAVCVFLGVNDIGNSAPIGSFVDSTNISDFDLSTFCGGIQACLNYLQNNYEDSLILIGFTPAGNNFNPNVSIGTYIEAMKTIAEKYNVQYVDTLACGVTRMSATYSDCFENGTSGGHPTTEGHQRIGKGLAQKLLHSCC